MIKKTFSILNRMVAIPSIQVVFFNNMVFYLIVIYFKVAIPSIQVVFFNQEAFELLKETVEESRNPFYSGRFFQFCWN